jgi:hypothetical protein
MRRPNAETVEQREELNEEDLETLDFNQVRTH